MKKNFLSMTILVASTWMFLSACGSNTGQNQALQAPGVALADTTTVATKTEKEAEDDDDAQANNASGNQNGAPNVSDATLSNLQAAYAGETTASAKYAAYSKKAQEEGMTQIALLFKATSASEQIHANNHRSVIEEMGGKVSAIKPAFTVKTTRENLADAIAGESYEIATMYPEFLSTANAADNQLALTTFNYAFRTEQRHKLLYEKALAALKANQLGTLALQYFVCPTCGNTYDAPPPKRCRISMTDSERFVKINAV